MHSVLLALGEVEAEFFHSLVALAEAFSIASANTGSFSTNAVHGSMQLNLV